MVDGQRVLNGAFGVVKPHKTLSDERPVLRLIMDFRATNGALTGAAAIQHVVMPEGKVLRMSAEDLGQQYFPYGLELGCGSDAACAS